MAVLPHTANQNASPHSKASMIRLGMSSAAIIIALMCGADRFIDLPWMDFLRHGQIWMTLNASLCFCLLGACAMLSGQNRPQWLRIPRLLASWIVLALCAGVALEYALDFSWLDLNPFQVGQGRLTPLALAGSAFGAIGVISVDRKKAMATLSSLLAMGACAFIGVLSHAINFDYLYTVPSASKIPLSSCLCLALIAGALWSSWKSNPWAHLSDDKVQPRHIVSILDALVVALVALVSISGFGLSQSSSEALMKDQMAASSKDRRSFFENELLSAGSLARQLGARPADAKALSSLPGPNGLADPKATAPFSASAQSLVDDGFTYFAYFDKNSSLVAAMGKPLEIPEQSIPVNLGFKGQFTLLWSPAGYTLKSKIALYDAQALAGYIQSELPLPHLTRAHIEGTRQGATGDMVVCALDTSLGYEQQRCFPLRWGKAGLYPALLDGKPLPLTRAGRGEVSSEITTDFRRQRVLAALGPIGATGLGMAVKMDMVELYAPIRSQFFASIPYMLAFIVLGMWLFRWQLHPLVRALDRSRHELIRIANHDNLTGLPNRALFNDRLSQSLERSRRNKSHMALLYLDLDKFKSINDTYGHETGDKALQWFAKHLKSSVRSSDTVARLGVDEFCIILDHISNPTDADKVIEKIHAALASPRQTMPDGLTDSIRTSIGVAVCKDGGKTAVALLREADAALYQNKVLQAAAAKRAEASPRLG